MRFLKATLLALLAAAVPVAPVCAAPPAWGPEFGQSGYFALRHDMRKCASPGCGGFWLKRVNQPFTRCADGKPRSECYVAELEGAPETLFDTNAALLVRGSLRPRAYSGAGGVNLNLGFFSVVAAWRAAGPDAPFTGDASKVHYAGIESSGIVCITVPCPSFTEYRLNSPRQHLITGLDLSPAAAAPELEQKAINTVAGGGVLLVRGVTRQSQEGAELVFEALQFYLPVR